MSYFPVLSEMAKRSDGRPWSMLSFHLWDGERVAEVVAFGSAINGTLLSIGPGTTVKLTSAELLERRFSAITHRFSND